MKLTGKHILITGGTGSFGRAFTQFLLTQHQPERVVIFSRDEQKHYEMQRELTQWKGILHFVLGDLRDKDQVHQVVKGIDVVIHAAAMKHLPMAEENPYEAVKTNILGTQNLIDACIERQVAKVIAVSTDKAALPINVYGATKLIFERLLIAANQSLHNSGTKFTVVRYANVFGSKGSVVPLFLQMKGSGELPITHPEMSRFSMTMKEGLELVQYALENSLGGEIMVPKVPSYTVGTLAKAICPDCTLKVIGPRQAEKMHEVLVSDYEMPLAVENDKYLFILPEAGGLSKDDYLKAFNAKVVSSRPMYSSNMNESWLSISDIEIQLTELN